MNYKPKTVVEQASHQAQGKKKQQASQEVTWVRYEVNTITAAVTLGKASATADVAVMKQVPRSVQIG